MKKLCVKEILNKFSKNISHAQEVERISLMIFDEANEKIVEMSERERQYVSAGALLHDIGYFLDDKSHNKHSMKMILEYGLEEFDETETKIIACIARYHRGNLPDKKEHEIYNTLNKKERKIVKRLAGIVKLADGLDVEHKSLIKEININFSDDIAEIVIDTYKFDLSQAIRKRDLFEVGFKCQSVLKYS